MMRSVLEGISEFIVTIFCIIIMVIFLLIAGTCELLGGVFDDED